MGYAVNMQRQAGGVRVALPSRGRIRARLFGYAFVALSFVFTGALIVGVIH